MSSTVNGGVNMPGPASTEGVTFGPAAAPTQANAPYAGMGSWLEGDAKTVFDTANGLVLRCELPAQNHLALDTHYTRVKLGYGLQSRLDKDANKSTYKAVLEVGPRGMHHDAVPNKAWDLINKATETILVDPAEPDCQPMDDSEEAANAADLANRFLVEDGGEQGTDDNALLYEAVDGALTCATKYIEGWVDPVGGGYVPLQILAHPQAISPETPLVGPDGMPTPNPVLRYVTAPQGGQFTTEPAEAAPQWQPRIIGTVWGREHWRVFPESVPVQQAEKAIGLLYCTVGQAKRRWPEVRAMQPGQIAALLGWMPPRFTVLLPPFQRARYQLASGSTTEKSGSSDERIVFFYRVLQRASPDHPKGADVIISGANGGTLLHAQPLSADVTVPSPDGPKRETRCMDLPLVQVTPRADPDERDPTGRAYMELFAGATEFDTALATGYLEALSKWVNPDSYVPSTSSVQSFQVDESRATGEPIPITRPEDVPKYGNQPPIPTNFFEALAWNDRQIDSIASLNKPVTGADDQQEVSGKARQIAVQQAMVGLSRMQGPVNAAKCRWARVKIELAMREFTTPQLVRYTGEDGAYKQQQWTGVDFALVGKVTTKAGTGTMMPPEAKVQYVGNLKAAGMLTAEEANDVARRSFATRLGLGDDPHTQYIERCVGLWLEGPPKQQAATPGAPPPPDWATQWRTYQQAKAQYDAAMQQFQHQQQQYQIAVHYAALVAGGPPATGPKGPLGPEGQNAAAMTDYQNAVLMAQQYPLGPAPQPPATQLPSAPWTPFVARPNDQEPPIAMQWMRRLSRVISTVEYDTMIPEWQQALAEKYHAVMAVVQQAQPQPQPVHGKAA